MTFSWESAEGTLLHREGVSGLLGEEWADAWEFFARMVNHLTLEAAPNGDIGKAATEALRERIRSHIPASLEEILPFAVRYLWNHSITAPERDIFFSRLQDVSRLAGGNWEIPDLAHKVDQIMSV